MPHIRTKPQKQSHLLLPCPLLLLLLLLIPCFSFANDETGSPEGRTITAGDCRETFELLSQQQQEYRREFKQIKREIALLQEMVTRPGLREILGGIGYIFGLLGISYYWHARNLLKDRS